MAVAAIFFWTGCLHVFCVSAVSLKHNQLDKDVFKLNTYVALHSFSAQENHDLEMRWVKHTLTPHSSKKELVNPHAETSNETMT